MSQASSLIAAAMKRVREEKRVANCWYCGKPLSRQALTCEACKDLPAKEGFA